MFCSTAEPITDIAAYTNVVDIEAQYLLSSDLINSISYSRMDSFTISDSHYKFIRPVIVKQEPSTKGWVCYIDELVNYVGFGDTGQDALKDLKINIHTDFQQLSKKRPFEMSKEDQVKWVKITNFIDLLDYKTTTPVTVREIGRVSYRKVSRPTTIKWLSGRFYVIDPDRVPGELMACASGQWIEAIVKRDPITHREIGIESINRISFRIPTEPEVKKFHESLPKADIESTDLTW